MQIILLIIILAVSGLREGVLLAETGHGWSRFRGDHCAGVSDKSALPDSIGPETNVQWKISVFQGNSSPCISGDFIFLTGSKDEILYTFCIDRKSGKILWQKELKPERLEKPSRLAGLASPTPTSDGERVYVYFGSFGLLCYDFSGKEIWKKPLPIPNTQHGTGTSPILCEDKLVLLFDQDTDSYILAIDKNSGETVWKAGRPFARRGFATPLVINEDETVIVAPGTLQVVAYYARNGMEKWRVYGLPNEVCPSPIFADGLIYCCGWTPWSGTTRLSPFAAVLQQLDKDSDGKISISEAQSGQVKQHFAYADANKDGFLSGEEWEELSEIFSRSENSILAIRPGGKGDVTKTHVQWKQTRGLPYVPTPLYYKGKIWLIKNGGLLTCYEASSGIPVINEERIGAGGDYYASPVGGDNKIYLCSQAGVVTVIEAIDSLKIISQNRFNEQIMATPAIVDEVIYLRTTSSLYSFRKMR